MWVVFWMTDKEVDYFEIHETKKLAKSKYKHLITLTKVSCAGYSKIKHGTEPHWYE